MPSDADIGRVICREEGKMETTWRDTTRGEMVFQHHSYLGSRYYFFSLCGLCTVFLLHALLSSLVGFIGVSESPVWLTVMPDILIVAIIPLFLLVPAWVTFAGRNLVVADIPRGRVVSIFDLRFFRVKRVYPLVNVVAVRVRPRAARESRLTTRSYVVELHLEDHDPVIVGYEATSADARTVAHVMADVLHLSSSKNSEPEMDRYSPYGLLVKPVKRQETGTAREELVVEPKTPLSDETGQV